MSEPNPTDPADLRFATVAIVGVGLIGGSVAAALKQRSLCQTVVGVGRDLKRLEEARRRGLIDRALTDLPEAAKSADLLVFCTPVDRIVAGVREAAGSCRQGTIITDVGSVKGSICDALAGTMPAAVEFVGSHPLAGSEKQGFEHADARLFEGRVCVVTPVAANSRPALDRVAGFWKSLGSRTLEMTPAAHDAALAETSHLPHIVAATLAATLTPANRPLTASGFRDTTRIAAGDPDLWTAILLANAGPILDSLDRFDERLSALRAALAENDAARIKEFLLASKIKRDALPKLHADA